MKNNMRLCMGGLLLVVFGALNMLFSLIRGATTFWYILADSPETFFSLMGYVLRNALLSLAPLAALGIVLLVKQPGLPAAITAGIAVVCLLINMIFYFYWPKIILMLTLASVILLALPYFVRNTAVMQKLWFLPGTLYSVYWLCSTIAAFSNYHATGYLLVRMILRELSSCILDMGMIAAFFLLGHWMAKPWKKPPAPLSAFLQTAYYSRRYLNGKITPEAYLDIIKQLNGQ